MRGPFGTKSATTCVFLIISQAKRRFQHNSFNQVDATYRSDLRELNELNFARFDAKVEQRFAEADAKFEKRFAAAEVGLEKRFATTEVKLEKRFAAFELNIKERLGEIETRIADLRTDFFRWSIGLFIAMAGLVVGLLKFLP